MFDVELSPITLCHAKSSTRGIVMYAIDSLLSAHLSTKRSNELSRNWLAAGDVAVTTVWLREPVAGGAASVAVLDHARTSTKGASDAFEDGALNRAEVVPVRCS